MATVNDPELVTSHSMPITGLDPSTTYRYRVKSADAAENESAFSDWEIVTTDEEGGGGGEVLEGIWLSPSEIAARPGSGSSYNDVLGHANSTWGPATLGSGSNPSHPSDVLAGGFMAAKNDSDSLRNKVTTALSNLMSVGFVLDEGIEAVIVARHVPAYVVAADCIDLSSHNPTVHADWQEFLDDLINTTYPAPGGSHSLASASANRANNWGAASDAALIAIALYNDDTSLLATMESRFRGRLGDRSEYIWTDYGDTTYRQSSPDSLSRPINQAGATKTINGSSRNVDGCQPEEQRRSGTSWPPVKGPYPMSNMQHLVTAAEMLSRKGYAAYAWSDSAIKRAADFLENTIHSDADVYELRDGAAEWCAPVLNAAYSESYAWSPAMPRGFFGYGDWTHG